MARFFIKERAIEKKVLKTEQQVHESFRKLEMSDQESFWIICYDKARNTILVDCVFIGGEDTCNVYQKLLFKRIFSVDTYSFRVIHNHPTGDPKPSHMDTFLTKQIATASNMFNLEFIDHMIIGYNSYYSYRESFKVNNLKNVSGLFSD